MSYRIVAAGRRFSAELALTLSAEDAFRAAALQQVSHSKKRGTPDERAEQALASLASASSKVLDAVCIPCDEAAAPLSVGDGHAALTAPTVVARNVPRSLLRRPGERNLGSAFHGIVGPAVPSHTAAGGWAWSPLTEGDLVELRVVDANLLAAKREQESDARYRYTKQSTKLSAEMEAELAFAEREAYKHTVYSLRMSKPGHDIDACPICQLGSTLAAGQLAQEPVPPFDAEDENYSDAEEAEAEYRQVEATRREARHAARMAQRKLAAMQKDVILRHSQLHFDVVVIGDMREAVVSSLLPSHVLAEERRRQAGFRRTTVNHSHETEHHGTLAKLSDENSGEEVINLVSAASWCRDVAAREPTDLFQAKVKCLLEQQEERDRQARLVGEAGSSAVLTPAGTVLCLRGLSGLQRMAAAGGEETADKRQDAFEFGMTPVPDALSLQQGSSVAGHARRAFHICTFDVDMDYASFPGPTLVFAPPPLTQEEADHEDAELLPVSRAPLLRARFEDEKVNARTEMIT